CIFWRILGRNHARRVARRSRFEPQVDLNTKDPAHAATASRLRNVNFFIGGGKKGSRIEFDSVPTPHHRTKNKGPRPVSGCRDFSTRCYQTDLYLSVEPLA